MDGSYGKLMAIVLYKLIFFCSYQILFNIKHGDEVEYVFGHPILDSSAHFTTAEQGLSRRIMNYFATFAKTG